MPKLLNKLPKYSLHKATGQAKVRIQGRDHYLGKHGTPEAWEKTQPQSPEKPESTSPTKSNESSKEEEKRSLLDHLHDEYLAGNLRPVSEQPKQPPAG